MGLSAGHGTAGSPVLCPDAGQWREGKERGSELKSVLSLNSMGRAATSHPFHTEEIGTPFLFFSSWEHLVKHPPAHRGVRCQTSLQTDKGRGRSCYLGEGGESALDIWRWGLAMFDDSFVPSSLGKTADLAGRSHFLRSRGGRTERRVGCGGSKAHVTAKAVLSKATLSSGFLP